MNGLLVVDKPAGPTSHDIVNQIRRIFGTRKVGHAGTLDPPATGLMLVGLGKATRLLGFLQGLPKSYRAQVQFGTTTATQDADGEILQERGCLFTMQELAAAAGLHTGEIEQVPPMVSAVKVGGRPLYKAARAGEEVERSPRRVHVYELKVEEFDPDLYWAEIFVRCSSGTYVRTLAADIGETLGCGAHLASLRRTAVGSFTELEAVAVDSLRGESTETLDLRTAMRDFPSVVVDSSGESDVAHGRPITLQQPARAGELPVLGRPRSGDRPPHETGMTSGVPVVVLNSNGELLAVYRQSPGGLKPAAVLVG